MIFLNMPLCRLRFARTLLLSGWVLLSGCTTVVEEPAAPSVSREDVIAAQFERAKSSYQAEDYTVAAGLMRALAEGGHLQAQYVLGYMYYYGQGMPRNEREAIRWIATAAARGYPKAREALRELERGESAPRLAQ